MYPLHLATVGRAAFFLSAQWATSCSVDATPAGGHDRMARQAAWLQHGFFFSNRPTMHITSSWIRSSGYLLPIAEEIAPTVKTLKETVRNTQTNIRSNGISRYFLICFEILNFHCSLLTPVSHHVGPQNRILHMKIPPRDTSIAGNQVLTELWPKHWKSWRQKK